MTNTTNDFDHRAVMYLRIASGQPEDAAAIAHQREGCQRIAERHSLTVVREYIDIGCPAHLDRQIGLQRLLSELESLRDAAFVVVWNYARLGRSMDQLDAVIQAIRACGAEITTITGVEAADRFVQGREQHNPTQ
jgi:DNA invertase Pin-like site-specific DNA recombinase